MKLQSKSEFQTDQSAWVDQILGIFYVLLGLAVIVSLFGIVNTLALSVLERTRELGMLRAIGMSRRQVRRMIRHESVVTALIGAVLGIAVGLFLAALATTALSERGAALRGPGRLAGGLHGRGGGGRSAGRDGPGPPGLPPRRAEGAAVRVAERRRPTAASSIRAAVGPAISSQGVPAEAFASAFARAGGFPGVAVTRWVAVSMRASSPESPTTSSRPPFSSRAAPRRFGRSRSMHAAVRPFGVERVHERVLVPAVERVRPAALCVRHARQRHSAHVLVGLARDRRPAPGRDGGRACRRPGRRRRSRRAAIGTR